MEDAEVVCVCLRSECSGKHVSPLSESVVPEQRSRQLVRAATSIGMRYAIEQMPRQRSLT